MFTFITQPRFVSPARLVSVVGGVLALALGLAGLSSARAANPIITDVLTADPAALVYDGTVYIYTGHDEAADRTSGYRMNNWLVFSSTDMAHWTAHPSPLSLKDFSWARSVAWAGQVIARATRFCAGRLPCAASRSIFDSP